jgi:hypothetical protein
MSKWLANIVDPAVFVTYGARGHVLTPKVPLWRRLLGVGR